MDVTTISTIIGAILGLLGVGVAIAQASIATKTEKRSIDTAVKQVAQAKPADIQQIAASQLELNNAYYRGVLQQSRLSFVRAILLAGAGLGIFFFVARSPETPTTLGITGGALTELLSALNFYLYGRASSQLDIFHARLDKLQFFVLANSICENLNDELKYETRAQLVLAVTNLLVPNTPTNTSNNGQKNLQEILATKSKQTNHKLKQENTEDSVNM